MMPHLAQKIKQYALNENAITQEGLDRRFLQDGVCYAEKSMIRWKGLYTVCDGVPSIVVNSDLSPFEKLIVSCHEYGHHLLHVPATRFFCEGTLRKSEYEAHAFASILLIPTHLLFSMTLAEMREEFGHPEKLLMLRKRAYEHFRL